MKASRSTLGRLLDALHAVADAPAPIPPADLAARLGLAPASIYRLLDQMRVEGLVTATEDRAYTLGPGALRLAGVLQRAARAENFAIPLLRKLAAETGETAVLNRRVAGDPMSIVAAVAESDKLLSCVIDVGDLRPLVAGAGGKTILAFLPPDEMRGLVPSRGKPARAARETLQRELRTIRESGYALSQEERLAGAVGIAAPIFEAGGRLFGALGVIAPESRLRGRAVPRFIRAVREKAAALSDLLGGSPAATPSGAAHAR